MEKAGIPAVSIVTAPFRVTGAAMAEQWGAAGYRFLDMPHPIANLSEDDLNARADSLIEDVVELFLRGQADH